MTADPPLERDDIAREVTSAPRPMYWSIRRELWENRSITIGLLVVTAVVVFSSLIVTLGLPQKMRTLANVPLAKQHATVLGPMTMAPAPIMLASFIIGFFYAVDALFGERRDRSILFWKSLPVSDRTTVLAKAAIPLVVLPLGAFLLSVLTQVILLFAGTVVLAGSGISPARLWTEYAFFQSVMTMFYGLAVHTLWFAPIYTWVLLVSAWARRAPVLWVLLPFFAIGVIEKIVAGSTVFLSLMLYRINGAMRLAFVSGPGPSGEYHRISELDPWRFFGSPGLWLGLLAAALFIAAAIRLRHNREPI